jgi:hypothetical protein
MDHFAGLDVSVKETSVCIVDDTGRIVREVKVPSEPEALLAVLTNLAYHFKRIGLEATSLNHQPEAQHLKSSAIHKLPAGYPILPQQRPLAAYLISLLSEHSFPVNKIGVSRDIPCRLPPRSWTSQPLWRQS